MSDHPVHQTFTIAGGGGKGGGGGHEDKNTLKSRQLAHIADLISEGPIKGVVGGLQGVLLDGTAMQNADGSMNFKDASVTFVNGYPDQPVMTGFESQRNELGVSLQLKQNVAQTRTITNTNVDRCQVTVSVPALQYSDDEGNMHGHQTAFNLYVQNNGGGYQLVGSYVIKGKTISKYQRSYTFNLSAPGPWDIRLTRTQPDSSSSKLQNDLYWDSYSEIIDDKVNYTLSACVGVTIDSEQFPSVPKRSYLVDGMLCQIPTNYNPYTGVYTGAWNGLFKIDWTNNPAWVLYDLIDNDRYGIGKFISSAQIDRWSFYKAGVWCDGYVPNGKGSYERRHTCNVQITDKAEAFNLLNELASIFRGFVYWNGAQLVAFADQPSDPVFQYTNGNVVGGGFAYSGADRRARHTMCSVEWQDPEFLGEKRLAVTENQAQISKLGINQIDMVGVGCTSESEALRAGEWALYTEEYESEAVTFETGLESAWCKPGDIIRVMDVNVAGKRRGGRVASASLNSVIFDAPVGGFEEDVSSLYLSCVVAEGAVETRLCGGISTTNATVLQPFSSVPLTDSVFVVTATEGLNPTLWRVLGVKQKGRDRYEIEGIKHYPSKWNYIEQNLKLTIPDVSDIEYRPKPVTGFAIVEYLVLLSPISVGVRATLSWISNAPFFDVYWRPENGNWTHRRVETQALDIEVIEGIYDFQVVPINALGIRGAANTVSYTILGRFVPPGPPVNFRINVVDGVALFEWDPAPELDVIIGGHFEMRHTTRFDGATWHTSQVVIPTIPGSATSAEASYQHGTWFLRTFDIVGQPSATWAVIIVTQPDTRYMQYVRFCEQPLYTGTKVRTVVKMPQEWLTIDLTGVPAASPRDGTYTFSQQLDAGGIFQVRLTAEILAFQYTVPDNFIDARATKVDTWPDWDDVTADMQGAITLLVRQTDQDPTTGSPTWTPWVQFINGEYTGRGWQFMALLDAPGGQNIGVEELCILVDLRNKIDQGIDLNYPSATQRVTFAIKFYLEPSVVIMVQNALETDKVQIVAKTRTYFDVAITNGAGVHQARTFDWHAVGY